MPYFFLSYAGDNAKGRVNPYVKQFFEDLEEEICTIGEPLSDIVDDIGFYDMRIKIGESWPDILKRALGSCKAFVPLYSKKYFTRPNCGKEWHAFYSRLRDHSNSSDTSVVPPLILPVLWTPVDLGERGLPAHIQNMHYDCGGLSEVYRKHGLRYLMQMKKEAEYQEVVIVLAKRILASIEEHNLPDEPEVGEFANLPSAFDSPKDEADKTSPEVSRNGPTHVEFFIAAARADEMAHVPQRLAYYGDESIYWKPYFPRLPREVALLVQSVADANNCICHSFNLGPGLADKLIDAQRRQNIVVIVVDPWSLDVSDYASHLRDYDRSGFWNCAAIVSWDEADPEANTYSDDLRQRLLQVFENKMAPGNSGTFRDRVTSPESFAREVAEVLFGIRQKMFEMAKEVRKVAGREVPLARIQGPGSSPAS